MSSFVDVSINISQIDQSYSYRVPAEFEGCLQPGSLVLVPFGRRLAQGVVLAHQERPEVEDLKDVLELLSDEPVLTPQQLELAQWLSVATMAPLGACVGLMLPVGLSRRADVLYTLRDSALNEELFTALSPLQKRLVKETMR